MPKVVSYNTQQVQQDKLATPLQRLNSAGAFGEQLGQGLQNLSSDLDKISAENDMAVAKERTNILRDKLREAMYHSDNAYYRSNGRDAMMGRDMARDTVTKLRQEVGKGLSGRQLKLYDTIAQQYQDREYDGIESHAFKGRNSWLDQNDKTAIESAQQDLAIHTSDPTPYLKQIEVAVLNQANRNGWDKDTLDLETSKAKTAAHMGAIDTLLERSPGDAKAYYETHKDAILPTLRDEIEGKISGQVDAQLAQQAADGIRLSGGTREERLAQVNQIEDANQRNLARTQVISDLQQEKLAEQEGQLAAYDEALKAINGGMSATQWQLANPKQWGQMSGTQQRQLLKGNATETDMRAYWEIKGLMATSKAAARDYLLDNLDKFSSADAKSMMDALHKPPAGEANVLSNKAAFDKAATELFGARPSKGSSQKKWDSRYNVLMGYYQTQLDEWAANNPNSKHIPDQTRREILNGLYITAKQDARFLGVSLPWDEEVGLQDVPTDELPLIEAAIQAHGKTVTPELILDYYLRGKE